MRLCIKSIIVITLFLIGCAEQPERYFDQYSNQLHEGGWVPDSFPHDISEIYEVHDIDTNNVWVKFKIGVTPFDLSGYKEMSAIEIKESRFQMPGSTSWWIEDPFEHEAEFYEVIYRGLCSNSRLAYLVKPRFGRSYYWWCQSE